MKQKHHQRYLSMPIDEDMFWLLRECSAADKKEPAAWVRSLVETALKVRQEMKLGKIGKLEVPFQ